MSRQIPIMTTYQCLYNKPAEMYSFQGNTVPTLDLNKLTFIETKEIIFPKYRRFTDDQPETQKTAIMMPAISRQIKMAEASQSRGRSSRRRLVQREVWRCLDHLL